MDYKLLIVGVVAVVVFAVEKRQSHFAHIMMSDVLSVARMSPHRAVSSIAHRLHVGEMFPVDEDFKFTIYELNTKIQTLTNYISGDQKRYPDVDVTTDVLKIIAIVLSLFFSAFRLILSIIRSERSVITYAVLMAGVALYCIIVCVRANKPYLTEDVYRSTAEQLAAPIRELLEFYDAKEKYEYFRNESTSLGEKELSDYFNRYEDKYPVFDKDIESYVSVRTSAIKDTAEKYSKMLDSAIARSPRIISYDFFYVICAAVLAVVCL